MELAIGIETATWYDENHPEESIRFIKECGFEAIDFAFYRQYAQSFDKESLTSFFDQSIDDICSYYEPLKKAMKMHDIAFAQSHGLFPMYFQGEDARNTYVIEIAKKMIAVCDYLDCRTIVLHPWTGLTMSKDEEIAVNMNIYRQLIATAKKHRVKICLENLFRHRGLNCLEGACADAKEAVYYIDTLNAEAGEELFGFCLDTGHANLLGKNLYQYIKILKKRLAILHIHDNMGVDDNHMIPFTQLDAQGKQSCTDWDGFVKALKETGYDGPICFETLRGIWSLPNDCRKEGYQLISSIGRYFRKQIKE